MAVNEAGEVVGDVSEHDIACRAIAEGYDPTITFVGAIMREDFEWCFDDADLQDTAQTMKARNLTRLVVVDHQKHPKGTLSLEDLACVTLEPQSMARTIEAYAEYYEWS